MAVEERPASWAEWRARHHPQWLWLIGIEWVLEWLVYWCRGLAVFEVLEFAGRFSVLIALIVWLLETNDRTKQKHYRAWELVNSARGSTGDGGRRDALQDLNEDGVSLFAAPLTGAYLVAVELPKADLRRAFLAGTDLRGASLASADLRDGNLAGANLSGAGLHGTFLHGGNLRGADLGKAKLVGAFLFKADLTEADLRSVRLTNVAALGGARLCRTRMPDDNLCNRDCSEGESDDRSCPYLANQSPAQSSAEPSSNPVVSPPSRPSQSP